MATETIRRLDGTPDPEGPKVPGNEQTWWQGYQKSAASAGLTDTAMRILDLDSDYLLHNGILGAGQPESAESSWPETRLRRGLVMGSVQSGKTASLLGVTAKSLDHGVNIVVILAGTRVALWRQTYERTIAQLDGWSLSADSERRTRRVFLPSPNLVADARGTLELDGLYFATPNLVRRLLLEKRVLIAVVMKNADHLMNFGKYLHGVLEATFARSSNPLHMLVIDDEADDGSILDKDVEAGLAPDSDGLKQIPRHIARLWSGHLAPHETLHPNLFATYLAYTATPQANFLQSDHNPLSPSDFLAALRLPYDEGSVEPPRFPSFNEPLGVSRYYTGGEVFYRRIWGGNGSLCVSRDFPERGNFPDIGDFETAVDAEHSDLLSEALRAYFVAGAMRLLLSKRSLVSLRNASPDSEEAIRNLAPSPHSMLYHPSARIEEHFIAAKEIAKWSSKYDPSPPPNGIDQHDAGALPILSVRGLEARLVQEEDLWKRWLNDFEQSRERLSFLPGGQIYQKVEESQWNEIRRILVDEIFPHVRLAVVNSDPRADDRPRFQPEPVAGNKFIAPRDVFTIFVSGNVMARGVTLEGLAITLFLRSANDPLADTQMQMQRWFGYRGTHLWWCRVFLFNDQLDLFRAYHEGDEALRREIIEEMNRNPNKAPTPLVLQGTNFRATGKIANLRALPLCPGSDPFIRVIERGQLAAHNSKVLATLVDSEQWEEVLVAKIKRGLAMKRTLSLLEAAELLESLRYSEHDPSPLASNHDRWRALASELNLDAPEAPLFRSPNLHSGNPEAVSPPNCPYSIAAYLRLWNALLSRKARGLYPTDDRRTPWSMIDLNAYAKSAPRFYVGIRFGSAGICQDASLAARGVLRMERSSKDGVLRSTWGSRNPGEGENAYLGDQLFDYHVHNGVPPQQISGEPLWRRRGAPGLILFHVIRGEEGIPDAVTAGLALPSGGPDHIAALRPATGDQN